MTFINERINSGRQPTLALVFMPFAVSHCPSIQLGTLSESARRVGYAVDCHHLNLELAARLPRIHDQLCSFGGRLTGEWLFSIAAFGSHALQDDSAYFEVFPDEVHRLATTVLTPPEYLSSLRHVVLLQFIEECTVLAQWDKYDVVGFSSTFQQSVASLALARHIKSRWPKTIIVFGGANMAGEMGPEYARAFQFIDYVVVGEADATFPSLLTALAEGREPSDVPGLVSRSGKNIVASSGAPLRIDLDNLPIPNYDEYFERSSRLGFPPFNRALLFEASRGCWWGQKQHCTFCGLNATEMSFRRKSSERVLTELAALSRKYGVSTFQATDNILDMSYIGSLFQEIERRRYDYRFFYEVKANLRREDLRQLKAGGVRWIQPGIESMSTRVLKLMKKGCTMLQNVRLLKWARYYGIRVAWNLLWGFAGESLEDYESEFQVLGLLTHLEPPTSVGRVRMDRFSPMQFDRDRFPACFVTPEKSYEFVYPEYVALEKIAYYFDYELKGTTEAGAHIRTVELTECWRHAWESESRPSLTFRRTQDNLIIVDARNGRESVTTYAFSGMHATAYEFCTETMRGPDCLAEHLNRQSNGNPITRRKRWKRFFPSFVIEDLC